LYQYPVPLMKQELPDLTLLCFESYLFSSFSRAMQPTANVAIPHANGA
jgi:hypothetical protein